MSRKPIKTVKTLTNEPEEFICEDHKDLDPNAKEIENCPMVFIGKRANRDQQWEIQELIELKDPKNPDRGVKGTGKAFKYIWENLILEVRNVCEPGDSYKGVEKDSLWDAKGMEKETDEAVSHFYLGSSLNEGESKT